VWMHPIRRAGARPDEDLSRQNGESYPSARARPGEVTGGTAG
jgi:hypothetical protein